MEREGEREGNIRPTPFLNAWRHSFLLVFPREAGTLVLSSESICPLTVNVKSPWACKTSVGASLTPKTGFHA